MQKFKMAAILICLDLKNLLRNLICDGIFTWYECSLNSSLKSVFRCFFWQSEIQGGHHRKTSLCGPKSYITCIQGQILTFWSLQANKIMGPPETEPPSNSTAPVLNIFYCHTGDIYFSDIYIALSKLIAKKKIYI